MKTLFVAWSRLSRRTECLADSLQAKVLYLHGEKSNRFFRLWNVLQRTFKTYEILRNERPDVTFVQNPPVHAILPVFLYSIGYKKRFVIDAHTRALWVERIHHHFYILLLRFFSKFSVTLLLHNEDLRKIINHWRSHSFVLETWFPPWIKPGTREGGSPESLVVISSFSSDEPIEEILEALHEMERIRFFVTGDSKKIINKLGAPQRENIIFTGYLEKEEYFLLLQESDAVMVLTTRPYTLLCGAYEAVAFGKPLITSDLPLLRRHFHQGTIHVDNTATGIGKGIREGFSRLDDLRREILDLREKKDREWNEKFELLKGILYGKAGS